MAYLYKTDLTSISWQSFKDRLSEDHFDNGRSAEQLKSSYENSTYTMIVLDGSEIIATARVLSDGVCNAYLVDVWTFSPYRKQGVAKEMIVRLSANLEGQHIGLFTDDQVNYYQSIGFDIEPTGMSKVKGQWLKK